MLYARLEKLTPLSKPHGGGGSTKSRNQLQSQIGPRNIVLQPIVCMEDADLVGEIDGERRLWEIQRIRMEKDMIVVSQAMLGLCLSAGTALQHALLAVLLILLWG